MTRECPSCAAPVEEGVVVCRDCGGALPVFAPGSVLASRYELRGVLGEGGLGVVYRAFDRERGEEVALKVLQTDQPASAEAARRFRAEIEQARRVSPPNVCPILDCGEEGPRAYLSMEILPGEDLRQTLEKNLHGLPEGEALSAISQIASGLQAIHEVGILHGDLKTAHAIRDGHGVVRIVPFGMVKDPLSADESRGSIEYMSPEHCWGYTLDFRSDIYALGIVAFEVFTGGVPLRGDNPSETLLKQMREAPSFDREPGSRVPRRFVPVLVRALAKAGADRFASAEEFAQAMRSATSDTPAIGSPEAPAAASPGASPEPPPPTPAIGLPPAREAAAPGASPEPPSPTPADKSPASANRSGDSRRDERFEVPTDVVLRKIGPGGVLEKEERTIAHDLSRSGMRILTSWPDLHEGDQVAVQEVGGNFSTGAVVRHITKGHDRVLRVGVEFVGTRAPDRMVGTTTGVVRPAFDSSSPPSQAVKASAPMAAPRSSGPTSRPRNSGSTPRPRASASIPRPKDSGSTPRSRTSASIPRPKDSGSIPRPRTSTSIPRPAVPAKQTSTIPPRAVLMNLTSAVPRPGGGEPSGARPAPPRSAESILEEIATVRTTVRMLIAEAKIWEALECLARVQALADGTPEERAIRILTWETQAKVPSLMRAAHQNLEDLARSEPEDVAVHSALGRIFREARLSARARAAFTRVLALDPLNREATVALAVLNDPARHK